MEHENDHDEPITTAYLGNFSRETAELIAGQLEERGWVWWYKEPGWLAALWEHGIRMFVDREHLAEANDIAKAISADREAHGWPPLE